MCAGGVTGRMIALVTDAFGGHGGIARYNQAILKTVASLDDIGEIIVLPRLGQVSASALPLSVRQLPAASKAAYVGRLARLLNSRPRFDVVFCGHINLALLGATAAKLLGCPWWLQLHGIEAWDPPRRMIARAVETADLVTAVSRYTRGRFLAWANVEPQKVRVLPNTVDSRFAPGPKPVDLLHKYGLLGRRVLLTVGRLSAREQYKGHDRVIAALSALRPRFPDLVYALAGDGDDRPRLEALARSQGIADIVRFLGRVPDEELANHYRMADVFLMPSTGEGFGIVFLEAMACGVPAIGGDADGSVDPLSGSRLGHAVPPEQVADAIARVLQNPPRENDSCAMAARFGPEALAAQVAICVTSLRRLALELKQREPVLG